MSVYDIDPQTGQFRPKAPERLDPAAPEEKVITPECDRGDHYGCAGEPCQCTCHPRQTASCRQCGTATRKQCLICSAPWCASCFPIHAWSVRHDRHSG